MRPTALTQDELKTQVGIAALHYLVPHEWVGVGTGSTVNKFIEALATCPTPIKGAVSSSEASTQRMKALGIAVVDLQEVTRLAVYIDGADEIDGHGYMVKGGGAALTREKSWPHKPTNLFALQMHPSWFKSWADFHCRWKSFPWLHQPSFGGSWPSAVKPICA